MTVVLGSRTGGRTLAMPGVGSRLVVSDAFTRANGALNASTADTGQTWTSASSDIAIDTNQIKSDAVGSRIAVVPVGASNQYVSVVLAVMTSANFVGVIARYTDANNYYLADVGTNGNGRLWKGVAGVFTQLDGGGIPNFTFTAGDKLSLKVSGSNIGVYKNDVLVFAVVDTGLATGTNAGVRFNATATARLDDFSVRSA